MELVTQHLTKVREYAQAPEGLTCEGLVRQFGPPLDPQYLVVLINGIEVPQHLWERVTPKQHAVVIIAIVPGKGKKKNPLALIASIAIAIIAPGIGEAIAWSLVDTLTLDIASFALVSSAASAAAGFVLNSISGAVFKPSGQKIGNESMNGAGVQASPTYSLQGQSNRADYYGPVRRLFGRHQIYPTIACAPYIELIGDDSYLHVVYDIGAGDYAVEDVRIGQSAINYFDNANYVVHRNVKAPIFNWYWGVRSVDQYQLKMDANWTQVDTESECGDFQTTMVFPQGIATVNQETGASGWRKVTFEVQWSEFGTGAWKNVSAAASWTASRTISPADYQSNITFGQGPLLRSSDTWQDYGYKAGVSTMQMSSDVARAAGAYFIYNGQKYTLTTAITTALTNVSFTPALKTELVTQSYQEVPDQGNKVSTLSMQPVFLETLPTILYIAAPAFDVWDNRVIQMGLTLRIKPTDPPVAGKRYSVRVRQTGGAGDEKFAFGDMYLTALTSYSAIHSTVALRHEHTLLEVRIKANDQISGTLDNVTCIAHSYLWQWNDGVWTYDLSNNPAWALLEVLRGAMNKHPIADTKIDLASFQRWAEYCDELHPVHNIKRAEFDHMVDYFTTIFALAQTITASGRATMKPGDGKIGVVIDQPQTTPIQVFTPHNSKGFSGKRVFIEAPHAFRVRYMSRETWKMEERIVYNDGYGAHNATIFETLDMPGVTRQQQSWIDGRYRMAQGIHRQEVWTLDTDLENLVCTRGDMVEVCHDVARLGGLPSRIKSVTYNAQNEAVEWTLTEPVEFGNEPPSVLVSKGTGETWTLHGAAAVDYVNDAVVLTGVAGTYISTPDSAAASVTGDIDIRVNVAMADWMPAAASVLLGKWTGGGQLSYQFYVNANGGLYLSTTSDGATISSGASTPTAFADGAKRWVRVTRIATTGAITFYSSLDGATWTPITSTANAAGSLFDGTQPVEIGMQNGVSAPLNGKIYAAQIRNGIDGPLVLDLDVERDAPNVAQAYGYTIRSLNGIIHQGQFAAQINSYTVQPMVPVAGVGVGDLHVWGEMQKITYQFIVSKVEPQADLAATLTFVPYAGDAIFGADSGTIPIYAPIINPDLGAVAPAIIQKVTILQKIVFTNGAPVLSVDFDWQLYATASVSQWEVWIDWDLNPTGTYQLAGRVTSPHFTWLRDVNLMQSRDYPNTEFTVKVIAVNQFGARRTLNETPGTTDVIIGDITPPSAPPQFDIDFKRDTITLAWDHPNDIDLDHYIIRYSPNATNATFEEATVLAPSIPYPQRTYEAPARIGTYYIKAVDTSGNVSTEYASAYTPVVSLWDLNQIAIIDDVPKEWTGAKSGFDVILGTPAVPGGFSDGFSDGFAVYKAPDGSYLESTELAAGVYPQRSEYYYTTTLDVGDIYQVRMQSKILATAFSSILGIPNMDDHINVWHEIRWASSSYPMAQWIPLASADPIGVGSSNFGPWFHFQVGDYIGRVFQFRLVAEYIGPEATPNVGVRINDAWVEADMPDRLEREFNTTCFAGGRRIYFDPPFMERPAISITPDILVEQDRYLITNQDRNGFDIEFFNGIYSVERKFDWIASGYGAKQNIPLAFLIAIAQMQHKGSGAAGPRIIVKTT